MLERRDEERALAGKVVVQQPLRDARQTRHLGDAHLLVRGVGEAIERQLEQLCASRVHVEPGAGLGLWHSHQCTNRVLKQLLTDVQ